MTEVIFFPVLEGLTWEKAGWSFQEELITVPLPPEATLTLTDTINKA